MSEVKRYGSAVFDSGLIEMSCGDYVTYSDYQKLVAENAKTQEHGDDLTIDNAELRVLITQTTDATGLPVTYSI